MSYPKKDFHGMTVNQARAEFHIFISEYLLSEEETWCELVTGEGSIKVAIIEELESLDLKYLIKATNLGCIMALV